MTPMMGGGLSVSEASAEASNGVTSSSRVGAKAPFTPHAEGAPSPQWHECELSGGSAASAVAATKYIEQLASDPSPTASGGSTSISSTSDAASSSPGPAAAPAEVAGAARPKNGSADPTAAYLRGLQDEFPFVQVRV